MAAETSTKDKNTKTTLDMDFINKAMTFVPSERCTISCGTVCIDPHAAKVLIIFNRRLGIWQLPKGRKNIGEDLHSAALRETYEETGVSAALFPLKVRTRSTQPSTVSDGSLNKTSAAPSKFPSTVLTTPVVSCPGTITTGARCVQSGTCSTTRSNGGRHGIHKPTQGDVTADPNVTCDLFNNELIGIIQYPDLQALTTGTIKTVFFYAALADSAAPIGPGAREDHEDLRAEWVDFPEADRCLRFGPERDVVRKAKEDMGRSGVIW